MFFYQIESQSAQFWRVVQRQHVQPIYRISYVDVSCFQQVYQFFFVLVRILNYGRLRTDVSDDFFENGVSHIQLVKVESFQLVQEHVEVVSEFQLFLSFFGIFLIPGASKALHGVLIQKLKQDRLAIFFDILGL